MKFTAVVAGIPLMVGALAAQSTNNGRLPGEGGQGVTVMLLPPSFETNEPLRYVLNEPAYVAAFVVYPGAGVRLLYPLVDQPETLHAAGYHTDHLIGAQFDAAAYEAVIGPTNRQGPAYLYMVASRHPLDVARYVHKPMALASAVGQQDSRSFYNDVQFDALLNNAISLGDDTSWDSDMYMLWPGANAQSSVANVNGSITASQMPIVCADGTTRMVPFNYPFLGCPGQKHLRPDRAVTRRPQQSASVNAPVIRPSAAKLAEGSTEGGSPTASPTVLPTIIGRRVTDAERRADIQQAAAASQGAIITAANGDDGSGQAVVASPAQTQVEVIDVGSGRIRDHAIRDGNGDGMHNQAHSAQQREQWQQQRQQQHQNAHLDGFPQLPPNPRLSPNPQLPPNPGMSAAPREPVRTASPPATAAPAKTP